MKAKHIFLRGIVGGLIIYLFSLLLTILPYLELEVEAKAYSCLLMCMGFAIITESVVFFSLRHRMMNMLACMLVMIATNITMVLAAAYTGAHVALINIVYPNRDSMTSSIDNKAGLGVVLFYLLLFVVCVFEIPVFGIATKTKATKSGDVDKISPSRLKMKNKSH